MLTKEMSTALDNSLGDMAGKLMTACCLPVSREMVQYSGQLSTVGQLYKFFDDKTHCRTLRYSQRFTRQLTKYVL